ncbi:DUF2510 domain-containing protein [Microbacterium sp. NPDC055903]
MSAPAGWYDAGQPGRQRWWDGAQWTAHERDAVAAPTVGATVQQPAAAEIAMGWYPVPGTVDVRWWDGTTWTPYRVRDGRPKPDAFAIEPAATGVVLGIVFYAVAALQLFSAVISGNTSFYVTPLLFVFAGTVWLVGGIASKGLSRLPAPQGGPLMDAVVRPLPTDVEGPGAGWYPVSGQATRWWTGTRWSWYVGMKFGPRPGHFGPRSYLISMICGWIVAAVAVCGILIGALGIGLSAAGDASVGAALGVIGIAFGVIFGLLALFVLLLTRSRRYAFTLPSTPPPVR